MSLEHPTARFDVISGRAGYTIPEFCLAHRISKSKLYELWGRNVGPRRMEVDGKIVISIEAAADWRLAMEQRTLAAGGSGAAA